ncbi:mediator of RNA polymerase II transcription subunit 13, partial [Ascosphaera pollenicola]
MTNTDFPAGALSNFRVVDSFSVVHWRLYVPVFYHSNAPMRNASDLQDSILKLRHADILAAPASDIFAIWMFCHDEKFSGLESSKDDSDHEVEDGAFIIAKREYIVLTAGSLALSDLLSNLATQGRAPLPFQYVHTLDGENQDSCANFLKDQATYYAFEIALRSAVLSSLSLRLSEGQQYIPLGARTLFSSISLEENSLYPDKPLRINSFLAKLNVDFTTSGKLLLSCQNAPQPGIEQLHPHESEGIMRIDDNEEVWLAPMGIKGKFIGRYKSSSLFPNDQEYPEIWKNVVVDWLDKFHLQMDPDERKLWIEVEIGTKDIPYFDDSTILPSSDEEPVRILWPARYSFHRPRQTYDDFVEEFRHFVEGAEGPLEFAARWIREAPMRAEQFRIAKERDAAGNAEQAAQSKDDLHDIELPESLGAPLPFAEALLGPGGMYPTPPDAPQPTSTSAS